MNIKFMLTNISILSLGIFSLPASAFDVAVKNVKFGDMILSLPTKVAGLAKITEDANGGKTLATEMFEFNIANGRKKNMKLADLLAGYESCDEIKQQKIIASGEGAEEIANTKNFYAIDKIVFFKENNTGIFESIWKIIDFNNSSCYQFNLQIQNVNVEPSALKNSPSYVAFKKGIEDGITMLINANTNN